MAERKEVSICVDDGHQGSLDEVAAALGRAGLEEGTVLRQVGVVTGRVDAARLSELRGVPGVSAVEEVRQVDVMRPPADG